MTNEAPQTPPTPKKDQNYSGWIALGAFAVLGLLIWSANRSSKGNAPVVTPSDNTVAVTTTVKTPPKTAGTTTPAKPITTTKPPVKKPGASASAPKQYVVDAAKFKASGYYIQIYPGCQATPGSLTVKKGSAVMFDNRNSKGHTIAYKGVNHWLAAYGYAVLTFSTTGDNYVTCDGGGSAKVVVVP